MIKYIMYLCIDSRIMFGVLCELWVVNLYIIILLECLFEGLNISYIMFCQDVPQLEEVKRLQKTFGLQVGPNNRQVGPNKRLQPPFGALGGLSNRSPRPTWTSKVASKRHSGSTWPSKVASKRHLGSTWPSELASKRNLGSTWPSKQASWSAPDLQKH